MNIAFGILTILFGYLDIKYKKSLIILCIITAFYFMFFSNNKFYNMIYYLFAIGLTQLFIVFYATLKQRIKYE